MTNNKQCGKLIVRNVQQKVLFKWELCGQLSDGYWENSNPHEHWRIWNNIDITVSTDGRVGRDFYPVKDNYNFTAPALLEAVGERMLKYAIVAIALGDELESFFKPLDPLYNERYISYIFDSEFNVVDLSNKAAYWNKAMQEAFKALPMDKLIVKCKAISQYYHMADLKRDLTDLKTICKTYI